MLLDNKQVGFVLTPNQSIPKEGPKVIPLILDFSTVDTWDLDGQYIGALGRFSMIQTVFIDMDGQANPLTLIVNGSGQKIIAKTNTQGYYNVMVPNPWKLQFRSTAGGNIAVPVYLLNVAIPGAVWPTA
jgi:hypothetical protein